MRKLLGFLVFSFLLGLGHAQSRPDPRNLLLFNAPHSIRWSYEMSVNTIALEYARELTPRLYLGLPFYLGYQFREGEDTRYATGGGLNMRWFRHAERQGGYPYLQGEAMRYRQYPDRRETAPTCDDYGNCYPPSHEPARTAWFGRLSAGYGYLWRWEQAILDTGLGLEIFHGDKEGRTGVMGNISVGFPF